ncbi:HTH-type transcriptional activator CmpR [Methylobacterium crusticola]|uniref:HTH-type transcriptional activator CmpR n=1 Tax=Methylobacterium crusticola TaxID=1697972 RepID=A0ABQ4R4X8_9HYPH|nr:LysR family transcriptional regulator [Methylobacterium crusticola]GJD51787.1 HTH-type transcriptional activator CmpR [Methylobacterium crusticola]
MNDRALRYFLAVVRTGSVRAAAEVLHVAASAVSRQVIEMEAEIGQPLLERLPRGVVPTEAGRVVAEHAMRQADERLLLGDRLRRLQGLQEGTVRIRCGGGFVADLVENGLTGFSESYAGIAFTVTLGTTDGILAAVAQGDADIGMAYDPPAHPDVRSVVSARQPLLAVLPQDHPMQGTSAVPLGTFATEPAALLPDDHGVRRMLGRVEADGDFRLTPRLVTGSFDLHRRLLVAGLAIGFLPRFVIAAELRAGLLRTIPLREVSLTDVRSHLLIRSGRRLPEATRRLLDHLAQSMIAFQGVSSTHRTHIPHTECETR